MKLFTVIDSGTRLALLTVVASVFYSLPLFAQAIQGQKKPPINVPSAPPAPASSDEKQLCPPLSIRANRTIEAELGMILDSNDQNPGKKFRINSLSETDFHACRMRQGAAVFGSITGAASSKDPRHSEISLGFDAVDCIGHSKQPINLAVIGIYVPPSAQSSGAREGYKKVRLEPQGGPHCSSRLVSTDPVLALAPGTILLLALQSAE